MKIFIVQSHLGGGGAERVGVLLANGFAARGHDIYILTNLHDAVDYEVDNNVKVLNIISATTNTVLKWLGAVRNVRRCVIKNNPDVIIGIMDLCSFISKLATVSTQSMVIATDHNSFERPDSAPLSKTKYFAKFYLNKIYRYITVLTQSDKGYIGNRLKNVIVMPNPLAISPATTIASRKKNILAAGRLDDWHCKGFDVLIRAWGKIVDSLKLRVESEEWKLQIAGTGSEKSLDYLKQLCKENGVEDSVEFLGFRKDVEKLYQEASVFVLSSRYEGFGLVLIEAMSQGCACIACDYKGRQREIVCPKGQGSKFNVQFSDSKPETRNLKLETRNYKNEECENGILCEPDNVEALAAGIQKMIEDEDYRESIRAKAIERSKFYSIENTMERWELLLNKVVKG